MVEGANLYVRAGRSVRQDHIELVKGEVGEQPIARVLLQTSRTGPTSFKAGVRTRSASSFGTTSAMRPSHVAACRRTVSERVEHLPAEIEDLLSVTKHNSTALVRTDAARSW